MSAVSVEIRQCWAYNVGGQRCDMPAGHPGDHGIQMTWTDDECYAPIKHQLPAKGPSGASEPAPKPAPEATGCVACSHKHKGGECKCGCYEFIG